MLTTLSANISSGELLLKSCLDVFFNLSGTVILVLVVSLNSFMQNVSLNKSTSINMVVLS